MKTQQSFRFNNVPKASWSWCVAVMALNLAAGFSNVAQAAVFDVEIGRASCRERV